MVKNASQHTLRGMYDTLLQAFGPQHWWPGDTPTEVAIGAILTQNTAWSNVEKAIDSLKESGNLCFIRINDLDEDSLGELIRSAGTFRVKAKRLKAFAAWVCDSFGGSIETALKGDVQEVRKVLLNLHGVGPETADAIALYAGNLETFVVDAYTRRILGRHGFIGPEAGYDETKELIEQAIPVDETIYNEFHALFVELGKRFCKTRANCDGCPLESWPVEKELL